MLRYMGYTIDRHALAGNKPGQVTIVSPTGKLVHAFQHSNFHEAGRTAMKWVCGLGAAREPDPDKERIEELEKAKLELLTGLANATAAMRMLRDGCSYRAATGGEVGLVEAPQTVLDKYASGAPPSPAPTTRPSGRSAG